MKTHIDKSSTTERFFIVITGDEWRRNKISLLCDNKEIAIDLINRLEIEIDKLRKE